MSNTNGVISKPVTVTDIATVLGVGTLQVGYLCANSHGKINIYSKKKPVRVDTVSELTDAQRKATNYGIEINGSSGIVTGGKWNYLAPDGTWKKRMLDFNGYNHKSGCPLVKGVDSITWNVFDSSALNLTIYAKYNIGGSGQFGGVTSDLNIEDLVASNNSSFPLKDMRLVAAIDTTHYAIADNTMGTTGNQSGISATKIAASTLQTALNEMTIGDTKNIHLLLTNGTASALSWTFPFPVSTYIPITKVRKFYYQFYPEHVTLDWGYTSTISLSQGATPTVFPLAMKNNLKAQSSTKSMNVSFAFRVYRASGITAEAISISALNVLCNAYNAYVNSFTFRVVNYIKGGTVTTIEKEYTGASEVTFPDAEVYSSTGGYYNVVISYTATVATLKENASANDNLASSAYFNANWWMKYRTVEMPSDFVVMQPDFRFKFANG